jgi:hypothetical protein
MLNPSTADSEQDDPTIRKCMGFAERWRCEQISVVNLFALRATNPKEMLASADPVGPLNHHYFYFALDQHVKCHDNAGSRKGPLVFAWGAHGGYMDRDSAVMELIAVSYTVRPMCLGITIEGHPRHPLYAPYDARVIPYVPRRSKRRVQIELRV